MSRPASLTAAPKWTGYLDFQGKPGTVRSLGQPDLFLPILQDANDLTFFNLRGQLQFDHTDNSEYNIGLGHRHMFQEWILGGYGYFDHRNTQYGSQFNQFTGGLEALSVDWAVRVNGYLPENKTTTFTGDADVSVIRPGDQIKVQIGGIVQEKALPGFDGEVGYLLPIPWPEGAQVFDETRLYVGGYHFFGEGNFESVSGPRARLEIRVYDLPVLGPGSRFMMGVEGQYDEPRGGQAFGLVSLRIPFDVFADKSRRRALKGLDRRMLQPVIRDVDVVTSDFDMPTETLSALNEAGRAYTKVVDVSTVAELAAINNNSDEVLAIIFTGNPADVEDMGDGDLRDIMAIGSLTLGADQTLTSAGKELRLGYVSQRLGAGIIGYTPDGTPVGLTGSIEMMSGSQVNGLRIDATGNEGNEFFMSPSWSTSNIRFEAGGIRILEKGNHYVTNMTVTDSANHGILIYNPEATVYLRDSNIIGNEGNGVRINAGELFAENIEVSYNGESGLRAHASVGINSKIEIITNRDSPTFKKRTSVSHNGWSGIEASNGGEVVARDIEVTNHDDSQLGYGVVSWGGDSEKGSKVTITDSTVSNNGRDGLSVQPSIGNSSKPNAIYAENLTIENSGRYGVSAFGGLLTLKNIEIIGAGSGGVYAKSDTAQNWKENLVTLDNVSMISANGPDVQSNGWGEVKIINSSTDLDLQCGTINDIKGRLIDEHGTDLCP